jgi:hypothetical protein
MELAVLFLAVIAVGVARPRWSSLAVALVPTGLAFLWFLFREEIPGESTTVGDVAWYAAFSVVVGVVFALACAAGVVTGRALRRAR